MTGDEDGIEKLRNRDFAEDDENLYENVDVSALPDWWQRAIKEFDEAGLRPYRPPRLADGSYKHEIVDDLEATYGVSIEFVGIQVNYGDDWTIRVDGQPVASVGHRRSSDGFSVFDIDAEEFRALIRDHVRNEHE